MSETADHQPIGPLNVLFACTANICRSAYLELRAPSLVTVSRVEFASGGTHGIMGRPLDHMMAQELARRGIDGSAHRSKPITPEQVSWADLILTVTRDHREILLRRHPGIVMKVLTVGQFLAAAEEAPPAAEEAPPAADPVRAAFVRRVAPAREDDIPDPYGLGSRAAVECALLCDHLLLRLGAALTPQ